MRRSSVIGRPLGGQAQAFSQGDAGLLQLHLHRPLRAAQRAGHLGGRQLPEGEQRHHLGLSARQPPHRPPEVTVLARQRRIGLLLLVGGQADQGPGLRQPPAHPRDGQVGGHPAHPGTRVVVAADAAPLAVGDHEGVLGDVLGGPAAARQGIGEPEHAGKLLQVHVLEPLRRASGGARQQIARRRSPAATARPARHGIPTRSTPLKAPHDSPPRTHRTIL
jgi:hypothetical protein